jgi:hypothetical protein
VEGVRMSDTERHTRGCRWCARERAVQDQYLALRVDIWTTARELIKTLGGGNPNPEDVLALSDFLAGPDD